jgi:hypothetical protein
MPAGAAVVERNLEVTSARLLEKRRPVEQFLLDQQPEIGEKRRAEVPSMNAE